MPLNLSDLLKKAEKKGILQQSEPASPSTQLLRPWQQESVLYSIDEKKLESKLSQSTAKVETKPKPNLSQSEVKLEPINSLKGDELEPNLSQTRVKLEPKVKPNLSQSKAKLKSNLSQTRAKLEPKAVFSSLIGLQRKIVLFIHEICQSILEQQTNPLSIEFIAEQCQSPKSAVRKAIQRLERKGIILRAAFKNGRGGWTQYQLSDQIYQEILMLKNQKLEPILSQTRAKLEPNLSQSEVKLRTELESELKPNVSSSSSFKDIKTTTTQISEEWNFDISSYARFGFTITQLKQLASLGSISAADVEQSLIEFNYDMDNNALPAIKTGKINFLMGLLRAGHLYISEKYKNEQEAMIAEMARRAAVKRENLLKEKFEAWESELTDEERKNILDKLPTSLMVIEKAHGISHHEIKNWYFEYYMRSFGAKTKG